MSETKSKRYEEEKRRFKRSREMKSYHNNFNSWEPIENLQNCPELLSEFEKFRAAKKDSTPEYDGYDDSDSDEQPHIQRELIMKRKELSTYNQASSSKKSVDHQRRGDKIFKDNPVDDKKKNRVFNKSVEFSTHDEYGEPSNKIKNRDYKSPAIKYKKSRIAISSKVENDIFNSSLMMTDCLKKENIETSSIGSSSGNAPKMSEQESSALSYKPSKFALMYQDKIPPCRHKLALSKDQKTIRKLDEQSNMSTASMDDHNRKEFGNQPVKREHKELANLICTNDQHEPMLSVPVRDDHNWCGRLYKKIVSAKNDYSEKFIGEITLNMMILFKKDPQFLQEIRRTDKLVIERVQSLKLLVKVIEHDAARGKEKDSSEPFYAIYLASEHDGKKSDLHLESKELRKKDEMAVISLNSWVLFLIPPYSSLCTQLRIERPTEPFIMLRYKKDKFPMNYLMQWSSETLSDLEESKFILVEKNQSDQIFDFMISVGARETTILDPHIDCILIYQKNFKKTPSPGLNYMDLRYKQGVKFYLIEEPGLIPSEILVSGGIIVITERALLKYDQILGNMQRFLNHNPGWELKIPTLILEKLKKKYLTQYNSHYYMLGRLCDEMSSLINECVSVKYLLADEIKDEETVDMNEYCYSSMNILFNKYYKSYRHFIIIDDQKYSLEMTTVYGVEIMTLDKFEQQIFHICN
ncbi:10877_t:CDS:10 [Dentiscutata erythropus]|uniref:10877_t:CDS:1 n=1 Tax=Dentiscutata erythropus TaxID=1348616 RepID=A0A9N9HRT3_9GLOM|nr:10877_t:CDS:10 [Dentiscutata erythropus]